MAAFVATTIVQAPVNIADTTSAVDTDVKAAQVVGRFND